MNCLKDFEMGMWNQQFQRERQVNAASGGIRQSQDDEVTFSQGIRILCGKNSRSLPYLYYDFRKTNASDQTWPISSFDNNTMDYSMLTI